MHKKPTIEQAIEYVSQTIIIAADGKNIASLKDIFTQNYGGFKFCCSNRNNGLKANYTNKVQAKKLISGLQTIPKTPMIIMAEMFEFDKRSSFNYGFQNLIKSPQRYMEQKYAYTYRDYCKIIPMLENMGINLMLDAPLSCHQDETNPAIYSENAQNVALMAKLINKTVAQESTKLSLCAKHLGYRRKEYNPQVDILKSFQIGGYPLDAVQISNSNHTIYREYLGKDSQIARYRKEAGFNGLVISSDFEARGFLNTDDFKEFYLQNLRSGVNMVLISHPNKVTLKEMPTLIEEIANNILDEYDRICKTLFSDYRSDSNLPPYKKGTINERDFEICHWHKLVDSYERIISWKRKKGIINDNSLATVVKLAEAS